MRARITTWVAAAALAAGSALAAAPATAANGNTSLAEVLAADGNKMDRNWRDFDIVDRAVLRVLNKKPGSPVAVLANGDAALTAFIPTDRAFQRLVKNLGGGKLKSELKVWRAVKAATGNVDTLEAILLFHVVPGSTIDYATAEGADGTVLNTALGQSLTVKVIGHKVKLRDAGAPNPRVIRGLSDINAGNPQIAHGINRVLLPAT